MHYSEQQRAKLSNEAIGKVVKGMDWIPEDEYWVITFADDSEISVRLMAELA